MTTDTVPFIRVDADKPAGLVNVGELLHYREILYFLITRDILVRYKQTLLGAAWAVIQPLTTMVIFTVFFSGVAKIKTNDIPYPLFSYAALVPWTFFSNGVTLASNSIVGQAHLVRKLYFPRLFIPLSRVLGGMVDFSLALMVLLVMMVFYGYTPLALSLVVVPGLTLLAMGATLGISLWFSALNVRYRDVNYLVPYFTQILLFASPIAYSSELIGKSERMLYGLNPMVSVMEGFRWVLLDGSPLPFLTFVLSLAMTLFLLITGLIFFRHAEGTFADIV